MQSEDAFKLVQSEFQLTQAQVDKYDSLLSQIKTWAITLWAALSGWSFQSKDKRILLLSVLIVLAFWALNAFNKNFREDYKKRRNGVADALRAYFKTGSWPEGFISPDLPLHKSGAAFKYFFEPHVFLLFLPLIIATLVLYFLVL